jgi:2-succinyl-5-enolpyruvyl-6-hydroxy-3-cyclohexene-1-carboxylate synthase
VKLVIVNNGGGKIFSRMFGNPVFQNQHEIGFGPWAEFWKLRYQLWEEVPSGRDETGSGTGSQVIELRPDPSATARFWEAYDRLCQKR